MEGISVRMGAMEEMEKGEVVCEDARYKMQDAGQTCSCIMDSTSYLKKPRSFNSSGVENIWIRDWYLNAFSLDQINLLASDSFILSDSSSTSSSVNLLLDMILFNSRIFSSSRFSVLLTTNCQFTFGNSSISSLNSSGISTLNSPISITYSNIDHAYIKHFLSKNFFASQKPLLKIRFAERTCAKN